MFKKENLPNLLTLARIVLILPEKSKEYFEFFVFERR